MDNIKYGQSDGSAVSALCLRENVDKASFFARYLPEYPVANEECVIAMDKFEEFSTALGAIEIISPVQLKSRPTAGFLRGEDFVAFLNPDDRDFFDQVAAVEEGGEVSPKIVSFSCIFLATNEAVLWQVLQVAKKYEYVAPKNMDNPVIAAVNYWMLDSDGDLVNPTHLIMKEEVDDLRADLYPGLDIDKLIQEFIKSDERVLILFGEPGVGKTAFIRYLLYQAYLANEKRDRDGDLLYQTAAYIKSSDVLEKDQLWMKLTRSPPNFVLLDDLDFALLPRREGQKDTFVSQFLSYSNGIFQAKEGTSKIIITTNQPMEQIDSALVRPGRCFDVLQLRNLTVDEAATIWVEGLGKDIEYFRKKFWSKTHVSQAELMSAAKDIDREVSRAYLLDSTVSVRSRYQDGLKALPPEQER